MRDMTTVVEHRDGEIERLQLIIKKLQRAQFGRRSKRLDDNQLVLDDLESDIGRVETAHPVSIVDAGEVQPKRKPLPSQLPREEILLDVPGRRLSMLWRGRRIGLSIGVEL